MNSGFTSSGASLGNSPGTLYLNFYKSVLNQRLADEFSSLQVLACFINAQTFFMGLVSTCFDVLGRCVLATSNHQHLPYRVIQHFSAIPFLKLIRRQGFK